MHWTDTAIFLSLRKHGENSGVARIFSREHGVYSGVLRGIHSKTKRGMFQPGNILTATWQARLSEQLGAFTTELVEANAALMMRDAGKLNALMAACAVMESALPERHPYPKLYENFRGFLTTLKESDDWAQDYVKLEMEILADSGFGLDLTACAATGGTQDLVYVSPKSGRAVSKEAGEPYKGKLLALPGFLLGNNSAVGSTPTLPLPPQGGGSSKALPLEGGGLGGGDLTANARELRKNPTDAEKALWHYLSREQLEGYKFRRQHPIGGRYIADFICLEQRLIVEVDGGQHSEQQEYDLIRTAFLETQGYRVLRFWNNEVLGNMEGVWLQISEALLTAPAVSPPPQPSPLEGEGVGNKEILAGLRLTGYFLEHWLLEPHKRRLPAARERLMNTMKEAYGTEA